MNNENLNNEVNNMGMNPEVLGTLPVNQNINTEVSNSDNLGNVAAPTPNVLPNEGSQPVDNTFTVNQTPVAQPIPGTENIIENPKQQKMDSNIINPGKVSDIGSIPPKSEVKEKKKNNKTLFFILIILLILAIGGGIYYFLFMGKTAYIVNLKEVTIGVGETLSMNLDDYAIVTQGDKTKCSPILVDIDTNTIGKYSFSVKCEDKTFSGGIINVSDITAPSVNYNILFKPVGSTITVADFINSCTDSSDCAEPEFISNNDLSEYTAVAGGPHNIPIKVSDNVGNSKTINGILYTTEIAPIAYTNCTSADAPLENYQATKKTTDIFPVGNSADATLIFLGYARRNYTYTFTNENEYNLVVGDKPNTIEFDNISGVGSYNDDELTLTISTDLSMNTLSLENNGEFSTSYVDFFTLYTTSKQYTCSNSADTITINE